VVRVGASNVFSSGLSIVAISGQRLIGQKLIQGIRNITRSNCTVAVRLDAVSGRMAIRC